ncbi:MAG: efflux RND transporter periplasmic adaptor subunit [Gammaproteobacteria bacterium]|nr:efflux RND transporter periplasmic adaptor subunit [Gammaproteobacteria bacterium]MDH5593170.1 efflux RND transporter periplasmic adaptor subunit [Gammaproteobacteria bacterium]
MMKFFIKFTCCLMLLVTSLVYAQEYVVDEKYDCLLEPSKVVNISSSVPGVLDKVAVDRGDYVKKGQILATLKSSVEKAAVDLTRARADFTQRKAERYEDLYKKNLISIHERDELATEARTAQMELKEAEELLKLRTIISPIDGVIIDRKNSSGEYVGFKPIMTLASMDPLNVEVIVPVEKFGKIKKGITALVYPGEPIGGEHMANITIVDEVIDAASNTFGVRLELPNPEHKIPAGTNCRILFP